MHIIVPVIVFYWIISKICFLTISIDISGKLDLIFKDVYKRQEDNLTDKFIGTYYTIFSLAEEIA